MLKIRGRCSVGQTQCVLRGQVIRGSRKLNTTLLTHKFRFAPERYEQEMATHRTCKPIEMKRSAISGTSHLTTMVMVLSTRILRNKTTTEVRFYLAPSSQRKSAEAGTLQDEFEDKARYRRPGE